MGQTLKNLSYRKAKERAVFDNRFVVEVCEKFHVHYRNLRILLNTQDWLSVAKGFKDALERWEKLGKPEAQEGVHYELCRKNIVGSEDMIKVNLNKNLYPKYEGKIFSEGHVIQDKEYIHLKIRDLRIEMSISEFEQLAEVIKDAKEKLVEDRNLSSVSA